MIQIKFSDFLLHWLDKKVVVIIYKRACKVAQVACMRIRSAVTCALGTRSQRERQSLLSNACCCFLAPRRGPALGFAQAVAAIHLLYAAGGR